MANCDSKKIPPIAPPKIKKSHLEGVYTRRMTLLSMWAKQRWIILSVVAIIMLALIVLKFMGRIWWCECGFGVWTWEAAAINTSQWLGDPYTFSHVLHGFIFYWALSPFKKYLSVPHRLLIALGIEVGWEILENSPIIINRYRANTASLDYYGDSVLNSFGDLLACLAGFWFAWRMPWWLTVAATVAIELLMLWLFRDNLTLNVIMLVYPIEAIKEWQLMNS